MRKATVSPAKVTSQMEAIPPEAGESSCDQNPLCLARQHPNRVCVCVCVCVCACVCARACVSVWACMMCTVGHVALWRRCPGDNWHFSPGGLWVSRVCVAGLWETPSVVDHFPPLPEGRDTAVAVYFSPHHYVK